MSSSGFIRVKMYFKSLNQPKYIHIYKPKLILRVKSSRNGTMQVTTFYSVLVNPKVTSIFFRFTSEYSLVLVANSNQSISVGH